MFCCWFNVNASIDWLINCLIDWLLLTSQLQLQVNAGSLSEQAGLQPGDAVIKINDVDVFNCRHKDAQDIVVRSGNNFVITVQR